MKFELIKVCKIAPDGSLNKMECMLYNSIAENGRTYEGGIISLDKKWLKISTLPDPLSGQWVRLSFDEQKREYFFYTSDQSFRHGESPYILFSELIELVDSVAVERYLLKEAANEE